MFMHCSIRTTSNSLLILAMTLGFGLTSVGVTVSWALAPSVSTAYGGGYYHYQNASPAYRHGVKTPFNSFPELPRLPSVQIPTPPVVPVPTLADLESNPQNAPQPYIGVDGIGYYSDDVMDEYDPSHYQNPNPRHHSVRGHLTENPQEPELAGNGRSAPAAEENGVEAESERPSGTDKTAKPRSSKEKKRKSLSRRDHYQRYSDKDLE